MNELKVARIGQCHNYAIFIASQYFQSIDDHINLTMCVKRFRWNLEKFFYNPIPLTATTRPFFPFLRTQWIYSEHDEIFEDSKIKYYKILYDISFSEAIKILIMKQNYEVTRVTMEVGDAELLFAILYEGKIVNLEEITEVTLPNFVTKLSDYVFQGFLYLETVILGERVEHLGKGCFSHCVSLKKVYLPPSVKQIGDGCFKGCLKLEEVEIAGMIEELPNELFKHCRSLNTIELPISITSCGAECFTGVPEDSIPDFIRPLLN